MATDDDGLSRVLRENMQALLEHRKKFEEQRTISDRLADRLSTWAGSMPFAYGHATLFTLWLVWNSVPGTPKWDPYPFVMLAMFASVEAIFLSTFVLVSQNRMARVSNARADLDLQINLLAEREISRLLTMTLAIGEKLGVEEPPRDAEDLQRDIGPRELLERIDRVEERGTVDG